MRLLAENLPLGAYGLLAVSLYLPWYQVRELIVRPGELPFAWALIVVLVVLAGLVVVARRCGPGRWLRPLPLAVGCFMLGLLVCLALAPLAVNALVARVLGQPADALAAELQGLARLPVVGGQVAEWQELLRSLPGRLAIDLEPGLAVFAVGAVLLVASGYHGVMARGDQTPPSPPFPSREGGEVRHA